MHHHQYNTGSTISASDKVISILRHTLNGNLVPALDTLNAHKHQMSAKQQHDLSQVNDIVERMDLIIRQTLQHSEISDNFSEHDDDDVNELIRVDRVLQALTHASTSMNSNAFFDHCVKTLAELYNCRYAMISILNPDNESVHTVSVWNHDHLANNFKYDLRGTPCQDVICLKKIMVSEGVCQQYPDDQLLVDMKADSYFGVPLMTTDQGILGLVAVLDTQAMEINQWTSSALSIFAARITSEVLRQQALDKLAALNDDLEDQVMQRTHELKQSNENLKAFNYSVSHDLRAPVRTINSYVEVIFEDHKDALPNEVLHQLQRIQHSGHLLDDIINNLLNLSRIGQQAVRLKCVDISQLAQKIIHHISQTQSSRHISIDISTDLNAWADENLLQIALDNLLSNAMKYTQNNSHTIIKIYAYHQDDEQIFCIQDNGAGFDMKYIDKIFQPFNRLHSEKEFAGTGIGLATVKRVFDCHNGRVWADSPESGGARFYFTLPTPAAHKTSE